MPGNNMKKEGEKKQNIDVSESNKMQCFLFMRQPVVFIANGAVFVLCGAWRSFFASSYPLYKREFLCPANKHTDFTTVTSMLKDVQTDEW